MLRVALAIAAGKERAIYGCVHSIGRAHVLEDPFHERNFVFDPPAIQVRGTLVAYAVDNHGRAQTFIDAYDLRFDPESGRSPAKGVPQRAGRSFGYVKVGSLSLTKRGSIAWIACPEDPDDGNPVANQRPGCVRPGRRDAVWVLPHDATKKVLLDRGRSIDPRSMTRRGLRFCWRRGGGLRCRRVP
jgi:hypothetical protein